MKSLIYIIIFFFAFSGTNSNSSNIIKFECEYDPNLIEKKQKNVNFNNKQKLDLKEICRKFKCKDVVEVNVEKAITGDKNKYRLRNSWFNHQGIMIDDFIMTKNNVTINTFVSQAYYLESYKINRSTGKTKRTFYKFDYYEILEDINKIEMFRSQHEYVFEVSKRGEALLLATKLSGQLIGNPKNKVTISPGMILIFLGSQEQLNRIRVHLKEVLVKTT